MHVVLTSDVGTADAELRTDLRETTLGEVSERLLGHVGPVVVRVDGVAWPESTTLFGASVANGSSIDVTGLDGPHMTDTEAVDPSTNDSEADHAGVPGRSAPIRVALVESAGFGGHRRVELSDGTYRIGPTHRINAPHLAPGSVDEALLTLEVRGQSLAVDVAVGRGASLDGELILGPTRWHKGPLVVGDRIFETAPIGEEYALAGCSIERLEVGRSLVPVDHTAPVTVDATAGLGIVADPTDSLALLSSIVSRIARGADDGLRLEIRSDRPTAWEWAKWLPCVSVDDIGSVDEFDADAPLQPDVLVLDRTEPDALPIALPSDTTLIASAMTASMLPARLGAIVEPIGTTRSTAVRVTAVEHGAPVDHRRVAPHTLDAELALTMARDLARASTEHPDHASDLVERVHEVDHAPPNRLTVRPWYVTRSATPTERRVLRVSASSSAAFENDEAVRPLPSSLHILMSAASIEPTRIVVPVGIWSDRHTVATLPLRIGARLAITGQEGIERSEVLALIADALAAAPAPRARSVELFALAPRGGALVDTARRQSGAIDTVDEPREVRAWLERVAACVRPVVFVDGADRVGGPSMRWLAGDDFRHAVVVVGTRPGLPDEHWTGPWQRSWLSITVSEGRGAFTTRNRTREILLVSPDADLDGDIAASPSTSAAADPASRTR